MAADRLKSLASRALGLWRVVKLFREVGHRGIPATADHVRAQTTRILDALDPVTRMVSEINEAGYAANVLSQTAGAAVAAAESAIEKTSIVLGHAILDEVLTECCQVSARLMPENWTGLVQNRKVTLGEALRTPAAEIGGQFLADYLDQLGRESMRTRVDILNQRYQPAPAFEYERRPYRFDRERLEAIDLHRQSILHKLELAREAEAREADDLLYLEATCFYFIYIVAHKHGIALDPMREALDRLRSKSISPVQLSYEGLLLATSLPFADEQVWSAGGQVFATANGRSRQLPLLMPAATPDVSSDHRQLVFVKYRQRPGVQLADCEGIFSQIGDIWISPIDGSNAECVLEGGPRPGLVPPVAGLFPEELEGITSPRFDPDARLVYFIAAAWTTSGAIYVLDLKSREVKYFTDGNAFVVLHGEPHRGSLLVSKHRYYEPPNQGSYDHLWLVSPAVEVGEDFGEDIDAALVKLYGPGGRKRAFPHLR
jgi:hypothetical protein